MRIGYQGEPESYSHLASGQLFPDADRVGHETFPAVFDAMERGEVDALCVPIENSTTGSVLGVLDRLVDSGLTITREHLVEVRHALLAAPGAVIEGIKEVWSHPEALAQAAQAITRAGWIPNPVHDTAGAVRLVGDRQDPTIAALARAEAAADHGLVVLRSNMIDHGENTTRFVVLERPEPGRTPRGNKSTIVFSTSHHPGALAMALVELGMRGANLTRIESRPTNDAWQYRFFVDLTHPPGRAGIEAIMEPTPATLADIHYLGTYDAASG